MAISNWFTDYSVTGYKLSSQLVVLNKNNVYFKAILK